MDKKDYDEFIKGLEIKAIKLKSLETELRYPYPPAGQLKVGEKVSTEFNIEESLLRATVTMNLNFRDTKTRRVIARIKIGLDLEYTYNTPPTEKSLQVFKETSLLVSAWPYLRFWVQTITQSFGWPPLVMPLLKIVSGEPEKIEENK